ncbi:unnamed protein product [Cuscuta epithymum]|uniref:Uncharacterized protein n=1 Tax=Cuscuta epithymum TaxID=186058 RepID=A0AAV0EFK7_9ASTE|nr:unnamed protein product [Cuscuta epithymum]
MRMLLKKFHYGVYFIIVLHFKFHVKTISFGFCYVWICKTLALGLGDESSVVTIVGSIMPSLGSASYIIFPKVINSESGPRADGYWWCFCYFRPFLNALILI